MQYELSYYLGKYRRQLLAGVIVLVLLLIGLVAFYTIRTSQQHQGKIAVPVEVVPRDAKVTLSTGEELTSRGTTYIKPGEYEVSVTKEGFETQNRPLRVSNDSVPYIYIGLAGKTKEAKEWQENNLSEYGRLELLTVEKNREYDTLFSSANPIIEGLPIQDPYYSIDYKNRDDRSIELIIWGTSPKNRQAAIDLLRNKNYEPTDYRVLYDGFDNPLETR